MAVKTAVLSGDSDDPAVWGGAVPAPGDRHVIPDGITVTYVTSGDIIGDAPDPAAVVWDCEGTGSVVLAPGVTIILRGELELGGAGSSLTGSPGSGIDIDAGAGLHYRIMVGDTTGFRALLSMQGTQGDPCRIRSIGPGIGNIQYGDAFFCDSINCTWTYFEDLGDATTQGLYSSQGGVVFDHCIFDRCGRIETWVEVPPSLDFVLTNCTVRNSVSTLNNECMRISVSDGDVGVGRSLDGSCLDGLYFLNGAAVSHTNVVAMGGVAGSASSADKLCLSWQDVLIGGGRDNLIPYATPDRGYHYRGVGTDNQHLVATHPRLSQTFTRQYGHIGIPRGSDSGDFFLCTEPSVGVGTLVHQIRNCVMTPNPDGIGGATLMSLQGGTSDTFKISAVQCTYYAGEDCGVMINEGNGAPGYADRITALDGCIAWAKSGATDASVIMPASLVITPAEGLITSANYNVQYNLTDPYNRIPAATYAATPGVDDIVVDPQFVDPDVNLGNWARDVLGATGTNLENQQVAIDALMAINIPDDPNYNANATVAGLIDYHIAGFNPRNIAIATAYNGDYAGAVEPYSTAPDDLTVDCTRQAWVLAASNTLQVSMHVTESRPSYYMLPVDTGDDAPTEVPVSGESASLLFFPPQVMVTFAAEKDVYVWAESDTTDGSLIVYR